MNTQIIKSKEASKTWLAVENGLKMNKPNNHHVFITTTNITESIVGMGKSFTISFIVVPNDNTFSIEKTNGGTSSVTGWQIFGYNSTGSTTEAPNTIILNFKNNYDNGIGSQAARKSYIASYPFKRSISYLVTVVFSVNSCIFYILYR